MIEKIIRWQEAERHDARKLGISIEAYHLLCLVAYSSGHKLKNYARLLEISTAAITGLADSLQRAGMTLRHRQPCDRRSWILSLTPKGNEAINSILTPKEKA